MTAVFVDGPKNGAVAEVADGAQSIGPVDGWLYTNTGATDADGRRIFRGKPLPTVAVTGVPDELIEDPAPPLNPFRRFPFLVDEFPAGALLGATPFANVTPNEEPNDGEPNPNRKERR